jgi:hypothetical protein
MSKIQSDHLSPIAPLMIIMRLMTMTHPDQTPYSENYHTASITIWAAALTSRSAKSEDYNNSILMGQKYQRSIKTMLILMAKKQFERFL